MVSCVKRIFAHMFSAKQTPENAVGRHGKGMIHGELCFGFYALDSLRKLLTALGKIRIEAPPPL